MDLLLTITACALITIACAPLLLLGLYLLADALGLKPEDIWPSRYIDTRKDKK